MALTKVSRGLLSTGIVDNSNATAITIDSDERVGIGTTSPQTSTKGLHVAHDATEGTPSFSLGEVIIAQRNFNSAQGCHIGIIGGSAGDSGLAFGDKDDSDIGKLNYNHGDNSMRFIVNTSEAFRIDSSLNLLVGKTSVGLNTVGVEFSTGGRTRFTRNNQNVVEVNRKSSNGSLITFNKDGTSFGSLQVLNNDNLAIMGSVADHGGIQFATHSMVPMEAGVDADGTVDLGSSSARWKDLYLSGGAFLGGTTSANQLDDYEEGTWTPVYKGSTTHPSSVTYNIQVGRYIKIGHQVVAQCRIRTSGALTQGVGALYVGGLPFNAKSVSNLFGGAIIHYAANWTDANAPSRGYLSANESRCVLVRYDTSDPRDEGTTSINAASLSQGSNSNDLICTIIYSSV
tara:strand:- start:657 stop:1856 length:1200 start_codon:yes stop_codon:yes gene_type:complete